MEYQIIRERSHLFSPTPNAQLVVTLPGSLSLDDVREAIGKVAERHELLRAAVALRGKDAFYVIGEPGYTVEALPAFAAGELVRQETRRVFDVEHGELVRFLWCREEEKLVISADHMAGDGPSLLYLARDIAAALAGKPEASPVPYREPEMTASRQKLPFSVSAMMKLNNFQWKSQGRAFTFAELGEMVTAYADKHPVAVCEEELTAEQTTALLDWCRKAGVELTSAVCSAFLCTAEENSFSVICSQRPQGYEGMGSFSGSVSVDHYPLPDADFVSKTSELHQRLTEKVSDPARAQVQLGFFKELDPTLIDSAYFAAFHGFQNPVSQRAMMMFGLKASPKSLAIHNLTAYADLGLDGLSFFPALTPNVRRAVALTMSGGRLRITMVYPSLEASEMQRVFTAALTMLLRNARQP